MMLHKTALSYRGSPELLHEEIKVSEAWPDIESCICVFAIEHKACTARVKLA